MADLKVSYADLESAIQLSQEINNELASSYQTVGDLKAYLESAKWSGQTRNAFLTYLNLISSYHADLMAIMQSHEAAVKSLKASVDAYNGSAEVGTIRGL